ncbi:MAG: Killing trait [Bradyrhizobium sp.]|jgi:hypothetical protein|nr:Killing trait [Bradyrhizobium sp.]
MTAAASDTNALNDQIRDAVEQLNASFEGMRSNVSEAAAYQAMAHAVALALQNTVLQQQHDHMLRNALTTAAASSLLEGRRDEAEAVLKLADERLGRQQNLSDEIAKIAQILKSIGEQFNARGNQTG